MGNYFLDQLRELEEYDPTQQRAPAGTTTGGQFTASSSTTQTQRRRRRRRPVIGINAGPIWDKPSMNAQLRRMRQMGIREVRMDVSPAAIQHAVMTGDWGEIDRRYLALRHHGMRMYPILGYSTSLGVDPGLMVDPNNPQSQIKLPDDPVAYAQSLKPFLERYHPPAVEVWNEPNYSRFAAGASPEKYAELYAAVKRQVMRSSPNTNVSTAGLAVRPGWERYAERMLKRFKRLGVHPDSMALHPYRGSPLAAVRTFRKLLDDSGFTKTHIDITEYGVDKRFHPAPRAQRMRMRRVTSSLLANSQELGINRIMPFHWTGSNYPWFNIRGTGTGRGLRDVLERL